MLAEAGHDKKTSFGVEDNDALDEEIEQTWVRAHVAGLLCMCVGLVMTSLPSLTDERFKKVAQGGWLRGWGWGFCALGVVLVLAGVVLFAEYPSTPHGVSFVVTLLGLGMMVTGPVLLHNGNRRLLTFLSRDAPGLYGFPKGCDVQVVAPPATAGAPPPCEDLVPVLGATGTVVGHSRGRVGVRFHNKGYHFLLSGSRQFLTKDGCIDAHGLFAPSDLQLIRRIPAGVVQTAPLDPDMV